MTAAAFRKLALSFPEATEGAHMGHADFRVRNKIFATLGPEEDWGMVKLTPQDQDWLIRDHPNVYRPAAGAWGRQGSTIVQLRNADAATVRVAMTTAWRNTAPKKLAQQHVDSV
jgi:hypothetical protein